MRRICRHIAGLLTALLGLAIGPALADKAQYLDMARRGWSYELRSTMVGRDMSIPVHINGRDLKGAQICLVGEPPTEGSRAVLDAFLTLLEHVHTVSAPLHEAGADISACGPGRAGPPRPLACSRAVAAVPTAQVAAAALRWPQQPTPPRACLGRR